MHCFNPAPGRQKLVEIITTPDTAADVDRDRPRADRQRRQVGVSANDRSGFIVSLLPLSVPQRRGQARRGRRGPSLHRRRDQRGPQASPMGLPSCSTWSATTSRWPSGGAVRRVRRANFAPAKTLEEEVAAGELGARPAKRLPHITERGARWSASVTLHHTALRFRRAVCPSGLFPWGKNWTSIAKQLSSGTGAAGLDRPHHGRSGWRERFDFLGHRGPGRRGDRGGRRRPVTLVGHSLGGQGRDGARPAAPGARRAAGRRRHLAGGLPAGGSSRNYVAAMKDMDLEPGRAPLRRRRAAGARGPGRHGALVPAAEPAPRSPPPPTAGAGR